MKLSLITATRHRDEHLASSALPSLVNQTCHDFEWVVINDGGDRATRELISNLNVPFPIVYREMPHPAQGFGLCHGRNMGLENASSQWVAYLDDDNSLDPEFVATMIQLFETHPSMRCSLPQQLRRRDVMRDGEVVRRGMPFVSPSDRCTSTALIHQKELFDSNGFTHYRQDAPRWNPEYRVFADYEYFLQSLSTWGHESFQVYGEVLVNYVQTSDGVIGQSNYQEWAMELRLLLEQREQYGILEAERQCLSDLIQVYCRQHQQGKVLAGFTL
jgi:glycosyltransferase involved in cell wall biosynthesis